MACKPQMQFKDHRTTDPKETEEAYFYLANTETPCSIRRDLSSSQLALTQNRIDKAHEEKVTEYKATLAETVSLELVKVRRLNGSVFYEFDYLINNHKLCEEQLRLHFDVDGQMTAVGAIDHQIVPQISYQWKELDLEAIRASEKIRNLNRSFHQKMSFRL